MAASGRQPTAALNPVAATTTDAAPRQQAVAPVAAAPLPPAPPGLLDRLAQEPFVFDFFQAVRLLEAAAPQAKPIGQEGPPNREVVRLMAHAALDFPPSALYDLEPPTAERPMPRLLVNFLGLTGPTGTLPRHYTELILRLSREAKGPERTALRDWFAVFDHRMLSFFARAWEKYRFWRAYERGEAFGRNPDPATTALFSIAGLGLPGLRDRLRVEVDGNTVAATDDLALLRYAGLLSHHPRNAASLERMLADHFGLPVRVEQFRSRWLPLELADVTRLGGANARLGIDALAGDRIRDIESTFRIVIGPVDYAQFQELLPDRSPVTERKMFFQVCQWVRLYAGPTLDYDVQVILRATEVPPLRMCTLDACGAQLGWNTWLVSLPAEHDATEAVFAGIDTCGL